MKKMMIVVIGLIAFALSNPDTNAQTTKKKEVTKTQTTQASNPQQNNGPFYVDKNNNGTCDNYENGNGRQGQPNRQGRGNGQGNGRGNGQGQGRNFVDANNDGVCDNANNSNCKNRRMRQRNSNCRRSSNN